jgi:hypothetical protein
MLHIWHKLHRPIPRVRSRQVSLPRRQTRYPKPPTHPARPPTGRKLRRLYIPTSIRICPKNPVRLSAIRKARGAAGISNPPATAPPQRHKKAANINWRLKKFRQVQHIGSIRYRTCIESQRAGRSFGGYWKTSDYTRTLDSNCTKDASIRHVFITLRRLFGRI